MLTRVAAMPRNHAMRRATAIVTGALAATLVTGCDGASETTAPSATSRLPQTAGAPLAPSTSVEPKGELLGPFPVTRVVDGDTIWIGTGSGNVKVRLIGIDTAETVDPSRPVGCFGPEASEVAKLLAGGTVRIELDASQGETDRYGRTLAYVWMSDGRMFNEMMIRDGFAYEYTYDDQYAHQSEFRTAQADAMRAREGLWGACPRGTSVAPR